MKTYRHLFVVAIVLVLLLTIGGSVLADDGGTVELTNLSEGATVSTLTTLTGTINFPEFMKYEIFLKTGGSMIWMANSHTPVFNGNLARLDPRVFNSGSYQVVVRKVKKDSNYTDFNGPTITINNPNKTALPYYPEVEPSFLYASTDYAILRAKNCAGEEFHFDYTSPQDFRSSGDVTLPGRVSETGICPFADFALVPGEYRGTAKGGAQTSGAPIGFVAEATKVYDLTYLGGGTRIEVHETTADAKVAAAPAATAETGKKAPAAVVAPATVAPVAPTAAPIATAKAEAMLPTTGNILNQTSIFGGIALVLIAALVVGGILATRKQRDPS